ncbi:MAG: ROK family protein [Erysipelothrix sp.]|nr:ROK family protein [Erysipelothrix sp.]
MKYALSIDIGGTNTRVSLIDNTLNVVAYESFTTEAQDPLLTLEKIENIIASYDKEIIGAGVSCPGPLDLKQGIILSPPNLPGWHGFELVKEMRNRFNMEVYLENDANLAGLAEAAVGAGKSHGTVQYLTISTGVGGGFVINGEIFQGSQGFAQEIANVILVPGGFKLGELQAGSLESIASGTAIVARAREKGIKALHAGEVNDLAQLNNAICIEIMEDAKEYLANAIATIYAFLDPEIVVLGGSVALKIDGFIEDVENRVKSKVYPVVAKHVKIRKALLGEDNGIIGGAILAFNKKEIDYVNS